MAEDGDETWAANPWQAQADAHVAFFQHAAAIFATGSYGAATNRVDAYAAGACPEVPRQLQPSIDGGVSPSSLASTSESPEVEELRRRNAFLALLVSRYERRAMDLEAENVGLLLLSREGGNGGCLSSGEGQQLLAGRLRDLEGTVALMEDEAVRREGELCDLRQCLHAEELAAASKAAGPRLAELEAERAEMRQKNGFLGGLVARFEEKTMGLQRKIDVLSSAQIDGDVDRQRASTHAEELRAAQSELERQRTENATAHEELLVLRVAQGVAEKRAEEHFESAESCNVVLRDLKREHNRESQDLLRRAQVFEKQKRDLEADRLRLEAEVAAFRAECSSTSTASLQDLQKQKDLNAQLLERLKNERARSGECEQAKALVAVTRQENESLNFRIDRLTQQLHMLVDNNDALEAENAAATSLLRYSA